VFLSSVKMVRFQNRPHAYFSSVSNPSSQYELLTVTLTTRQTCLQQPKRNELIPGLVECFVDLVDCSFTMLCVLYDWLVRGVRDLLPLTASTETQYC
jgi:hypothetical protein